MAKLVGVVESLDAVEEQYRGAYVEQDGKFVLDADIEGHPGVSGLKGALDKERASVKTLKASLAKAGSADEIAVGVARIAELEAKLAEVAGGKGGDDAVAKARQEAKHSASLEIAELKATTKKQLDESEARYRKVALTDRLKSLALRSDLVPELVDDAVRLNEHRFDLNEKGEVFLKDKDGDPSTIAPEVFWAEKYKAERPHFYKGGGGSGSGTRASSGGGASGTVTLSPEQASDAQAYAAALKEVGGDYSKIKVTTGA